MLACIIYVIIYYIILLHQTLIYWNRRCVRGNMNKIIIIIMIIAVCTRTETYFCGDVVLVYEWNSLLGANILSAS